MVNEESPDSSHDPQATEGKRTRIPKNFGNEFLTVDHADGENGSQVESTGETIRKNLKKAENNCILPSIANVIYVQLLTIKKPSKCYL